MIRSLFIVALALGLIGCKPKEKPLPPLLPETAHTFQAEGVPEPVQQSFRKEHKSAKVDKVLKEIVNGELHYFIKYTDAETGRKGDVEYNPKGEVAMPTPVR